MTWIVKVVALVAMLAVFYLAAAYIPRAFSVYRICERGIRIKLFGIITHTRIWWTEIASVEVVPLWKIPLFLQVSIPAYQFSKKRVVIRLRKGLVRNIVLSPKDPEAFAREVSERIRQAQTEAHTDRAL